MTHTAPAASDAPGTSSGPPAPPPGAARRAGSGAWPRALAGGLLAALAFLLAAFPARNTDLWAHLAEGRRLAREGLSAGRASLPPEWLFDLAAYGAHAAAGDAGLAAAKALVVVALALVLFGLSRRGPAGAGGARDGGAGWAVPAACTALAVLATATRLLPQPALLSCLFLALAFGLAQAGPGPWRALLPPWPLPLLFLAWANTDTRATLGLAVVALAWAGRALDEPPEGAAGASPGEAPGRPDRAHRLNRALALLAPLAVVVLAAMLNLARPLTLPRSPEWAALAAGAARTSPFSREYLDAFASSPAGLAYFPLLALGALSFAASRPRPAWSRLLPWLALALLGAAEARAIPFFAVVAGPVLAWNLRDALARVSNPDRPRGGRAGWPAALAGLAVLAALAGLVACAWPGWLQGPPYEPRRLALEPPPALVRGAAAVRAWHRDAGPAADGRALHLTPESASLFAWLCPEEPALAGDRLAAALVDAAGPAPEGRADEAAAQLRQAGVTHVVAHAADHRLEPLLARLFADPARWPLLALEGDLAVFGWRDPAAAGDPPLWRGRPMDLERLAFQPDEGDRAPHRPPPGAARDRPWWAALTRPAPARGTDRDRAALLLMHLEARQRSAPYRHRDAWEAGTSAGLAAAAAGWAVPAAPASPAFSLADAGTRLGMIRPRLPTAGEAPAPLDGLALQAYQAQALAQGDVPPGLAYLAVRAARRAVAADPDDARAHLLLGEATLHLLYATRERAWARRFPQLLQLRQAEAAAALARAAALAPNLALARLRLGAYYRDLGYLDLALEELRAAVRLGRAAGPLTGAPGDPRARLEEEVARLEADVASRRNLYAAGASTGLAYDRAALAMKHGLAGQARDLLLASDVAAFGPQGMALELELLLRTGRPENVRDWTLPEHQAVLGETSYHWLRAQALAALGDYARAGTELADLERAVAPASPGAQPPQNLMALLVARTILNVQPPWGGLPARFVGVLDQVESYSRLAALAGVLRRQADVRVLRGLLALEEGDTDEAEVAFARALAVAPGGAGGRDGERDGGRDGEGGGVDFAGRPVARAGLAWLTPPPAPHADPPGAGRD